VIGDGLRRIGDYTVGKEEDVLVVTRRQGLTVILPPPAEAGRGRCITIRSATPGGCKIVADPAGRIFDTVQPTGDLALEGNQARTFISDGAEAWFVIMDKG
jgi:hypothetical protein